MNAKQAVAVRIQELCKERGITVNTLANMAGTSPSTIYSMLNENNSDYLQKARKYGHFTGYKN